MTRKTPHDTAGQGPHHMGPLPAAPGCDCHICRPDAAYDPYDRQVIDTVLDHGWQVLAVSDDGRAAALTMGRMTTTTRARMSPRSPTPSASGTAAGTPSC